MAINPAEMYRGHAAHCVLLAYKRENPESKRVQLDMARIALDLAEQAEKNSQTSLVYETPTVRRRTPG